MDVYHAYQMDNTLDACPLDCCGCLYRVCHPEGAVCALTGEGCQFEEEEG